MRRLVLALLLFASVPAHAVQPDELLPDPALEARARALSAELRCMVCQNESIDDSEAPLARDLRLLVRQRIQAGDSDRSVLDFLVARYGEFVLLKPRFAWHTLVLWASPFFVLAAAGFGVLAASWRRRSEVDPLDDRERAALERILDDRDPAERLTNL